MEYIIIGFLTVNSLLLLGIAGSLAKLIKYTQLSNFQKNEWTRIIRAKKGSVDNSANYTNQGNWDGIPVDKNWDGVPN